MIWLAALHAACFAVAPFATLLGGHAFIAGAVPAGIGCAVTAVAVLRHGAADARTMVLASALARVVTTVAAWNRAALLLLLVGEAAMVVAAFAGVPVLVSGAVQLGAALAAGPVLWRATA